MSTNALSLILNEVTSIKMDEVVEPRDSRPKHAQSLGFVNHKAAKQLYTVGVRYCLEAEALLTEYKKENLSVREQQQLWIQIDRLQELSNIAFQLYWFEVYDELRLFGMIPKGHSTCTFEHFEICCIPDESPEAASSDYLNLDLLSAPPGPLQ